MLSSSFREYQPIPDYTQNYNPLYESRNYSGGEEREGFINSIPNLQKKQTNRSELFDFWREDAGQG